MNQEIYKSAQRLLKAHPEINEVFATEDGNLFFSRMHADNHNHTIKGTVTVINMDESKDTVQPTLNDEAQSQDIEPEHESKRPAKKKTTTK